MARDGDGSAADGEGDSLVAGVAIGAIAGVLVVSALVRSSQLMSLESTKSHTSN